MVNVFVSAKIGRVVFLDHFPECLGLFRESVESFRFHLRLVGVGKRHLVAKDEKVSAATLFGLGELFVQPMGGSMGIIADWVGIDDGKMHLLVVEGIAQL